MIGDLFLEDHTVVALDPFRWRAGLEYSVVSPDTFGQRAAFRFLLTPVIPGLVKKPILGGG